MVDILTNGLPAVEAACAEAIAHSVHSAYVVLNVLARQRDPGPPVTIPHADRAGIATCVMNRVSGWRLISSVPAFNRGHTMNRRVPP